MTTQPATRAFRVRPISAGDRDELARFYASLSPDSAEARFLGASPALGPAVAGRFCDADHRRREGLVAEVVEVRGPGGSGAIIGHVCLEPIGPGVAEMAIVVADAWRRQGVGRALLTEAIAWARRNGLERLEASMRGSNGAVLGLVRSMGEPVRLGTADAGVVDAVIDLRSPSSVPQAA
jgi:acetyltransferase